ncbi:LysR family transcriptional regulator [Noviherbaspirillum denitrificans]|uniref:LysR family transcriptional regulator n=1 Tax=Noviherbaspirillum denitrificans TaxID=1968433 RepID=A0A254TPJ6_9BURK|nr:LysR family transcriptional regulator [Noviherbaspirillum denitrificans]OWW21648.1 LysR family transcriptional regulator [Noviherbaspirillum denitrificans]
MIPFTLRQLEYFVAAARHGSTSRAAAALSVSQPSISTAIGELESLWKEALFYRKHAQGLELTSAGKRRYHQAQAVLQGAVALGAAQDGGISGELAVGCFSTLGPMYLPAIMRTFIELYPDVKLKIVEGDTEELVSQVERGMLDLAIIYDMGLLRELAITPLGQQSPYVLLPATHKLARQPSLRVSNLSGEPFILIDLPHSRDYFLSILHVGGATPRLVLKTHSIEMVRSLVANGHGVSILVTRPSRDYSYDGKRIVCKPLEGNLPPQKIVAAAAAEGRLSPAAEAFIRVARNHF